MTLPTKEQYEDALKIVVAYREEQERLLYIRLGLFKTDLLEFLSVNKIYGHVVTEIELREEFGTYNIITQKPPLEECYEGQYNWKVNELCEKHNVNAEFVYWLYHK